MGRTVGEWEDRIRARLGDLGVQQLLAEEQIPMALEDALAQFSIDKPRVAEVTFNGDGSTFEFDVAAAAAAGEEWVELWSRVTEVEYPANETDERLPPLLTEGDGADWIQFRDGRVRLLQDTPETGTNNVRIEYTILYPYPTDTATDDKVPEAFFNGIASLAAANMARSKAHEFARRRSVSVAGELFDRDPEPLFSAASRAEESYNKAVLGRDPEEGPPQQSARVRSSPLGLCRRGALRPGSGAALLGRLEGGGELQQGGPREGSRRGTAADRLRDVTDRGLRRRVISLRKGDVTMSHVAKSYVWQTPDGTGYVGRSPTGSCRMVARPGTVLADEVVEALGLEDLEDRTDYHAILSAAKEAGAEVSVVKDVTTTREETYADGSTKKVKVTKARVVMVPAEEVSSLV